VALLIKTLNTDIPDQIRRCQAERAAGIKGERPTVFASLLDSDLPGDEKMVDRLAHEALAVLGAGTETTTWTLAVITYHVLRQPAILARLTRELRDAAAMVHDDPHSSRAPRSWTALEKLPYLGAVIHEGLRLSYGVSTRTARVATHEDLVYHGTWTPPGRAAPVAVEHVVPRGWPVGMSTAVSHHDEQTWPDSHAFVPERWLHEDASRKKDLEQSLLSFSKGSRACIGMK
jgi:cytochrome P450